MPFSLGFWAAAAARALGVWSSTAAPAGLPQSISYSSGISGANWFYTQDEDAGAPANTYYYSTNGVSWTSGTLPTTAECKLISSPTRVVVLSNATTNGAAYSTNGTSWTSANLPYAGAINGGLWDGTRFLAVTSLTTTGGLMYSTTGATWSGIDVGNGGYDIATNGSGTYVVTSAINTATSRICTSDPTVAGNWSSITLPSATNWYSVAYGNGVFLAMHLSGAATSPDGVTWTARTCPSLPSSGFNKITFANGKFIMSGRKSSTDHGIWTASDPTLGNSGWTREYNFASSNVLAGWASSATKTIGIARSDNTLLIKE